MVHLILTTSDECKNGSSQKMFYNLGPKSRRQEVFNLKKFNETFIMKPHYDDGINLPLLPMTNKNIFTSRDGRRSPPFRHDHGSWWKGWAMELFSWKTSQAYQIFFPFNTKKGCSVKHFLNFIWWNNQAYCWMEKLSGVPATPFN